MTQCACVSILLSYYKADTGQHAVCVFLMNPQGFPKCQCATKQTQRRHKFIQHCVHLCLFISLPCLPTRFLLNYETSPTRDIQLASLTDCIKQNRKLLWPHDMVKSRFLFPHRSLCNTCTEANTQCLIRGRIV